MKKLLAIMVASVPFGMVAGTLRVWNNSPYSKITVNACYTEKDIPAGNYQDFDKGGAVCSSIVVRAHGDVLEANFPILDVPILNRKWKEVPVPANRGLKIQRRAQLRKGVRLSAPWGWDMSAATSQVVNVTDWNKSFWCGFDKDPSTCTTGQWQWAYEPINETTDIFNEEKYIGSEVEKTLNDLLKTCK